MRDKNKETLQEGQETSAAELTTTANGKKLYRQPLKIIVEIDVFAYVEANNKEEAMKSFDSQEFEEYMQKKGLDNVVEWYDDCPANYDLDYSELEEADPDEKKWRKVSVSDNGKFSIY